ncbi:MAG: flagellar hook-basal body complex protein [Phycisphaerales bacterium]|nr:flagellar hook-basal body complex protein [Phycisphaerales bacterium]
MASSTALFTGLSGLNANARSLDVIGNNIANSNTTAFKSSRLMFQNMFSRTLSGGSPPAETTGGTNPYQIGLGVRVAGTQRNFSGGTISATGDGRDLALEGRGFFIVQRGADTLYTRDGAFRQDDTQQLVTIDGDLVQGFGVDEDFNIIPGTLTNLTIPLGGLTLAEATTTARFAGNLNAGGDEATRGASVDLLGTATDGLALIPGATVPAGAGHSLETGSLLTEIEDPAQAGTPLFAAGQMIELRGAEKGTGVVPTARLTVAATTTVQNLMDFFRDALGLQTTITNPTGAPPGVTLNPTTGVVTLTGNTGTVNDLVIDPTDLRLLDSAGVFIRQPLVTDKSVSADGESIRTSFVAYDSLGTPVVVDLAMVLENASSAGTQWRYYAESDGDSDLSTAVATGTLQFDTLGELQTTAPIPIQIDRTGLGPGTPLAIALNFGGPGGDGDTLTALTDDESAIASTFQDGAPIGTLSGFAIDTDGVIIGAFTNGQTRTLGQVALATFTNQDGLVDEGDNLYRVGANSGPAQVTTAGTLGTGRIVAGALESSNVDLSQEFINMILASTGYSASSRVIRTTDELMQQLLVLGR